MEKKVKKEKQKKEAKPMIGGQALLEGVMMRSGTSMSMAVRLDNGDISVDSKRIKQKNKVVRKIPIIRGVLAFFSSLVTGTKIITKSSEALSEDEDGKKISKGALGFAVFLGLLLGVGIFFAAPFLLSLAIEGPINRAIESEAVAILVRSLVEGGIRLIIFVAYLGIMSALKSMRRMFSYHGAEHRVISCFEKNKPLTIENIQGCSTRHERCGTTFMFFVMIVAILVFSLTNWLLHLMGFSRTLFPSGRGGGFLFNLSRMGIRLALLPLVAGLSYELLRGLTFASRVKFFRVIFWPLRAPGLALQRLTTHKPTDEMAEVAKIAFLEVQKMDADSTLPEIDFGQARYKELREQLEERFLEKEIELAELDWIFCHITGYRRNELSRLKIITAKQNKKLKEILQKRLEEKKPLSHALGEVDFYGVKVKVDGRVLTPRAETEILCEAAIMAIGESESTVLDLCTGSGAIAKVLAKNTKARVTASDICENALELAKENLESTNVEIIKSDLFENLESRKFDIIVSNPPYIPTDEIEALQDEVKNHDPIIALDGGENGLAVYKKIIKDAKNFIHTGGVILFEVGFNQAGAVSKLLKKDFTNIEVIKDLCGNDRVIKGVLK